MDRVGQLSISQSFTPVPAETANAWTHGLGWGLSMVAAAALMQLVLPTGDWMTSLGCGVYCASLVALYAASTLSHTVVEPQRKSLFRMLDQVCIFLLIAGSYTPFLMSHVRTATGWTLLSAIWALTAIGVAVRLRSGERPMAFYWYVALAWAPAIVLKEVYAHTGMTGMTYVIAGGVAYLSGLWFFLNDHRHPYFHACWHCFVMVGSALHFLFHYRFVLV